MDVCGSSTGRSPHDKGGSRRTRVACRSTPRAPKGTLLGQDCSGGAMAAKATSLPVRKPVVRVVASGAPATRPAASTAAGRTAAKRSASGTAPAKRARAGRVSNRPRGVAGIVTMLPVSNRPR